MSPSQKIIWILLEGADDERFHKRILWPHVYEHQYDWPRYWHYSDKTEVQIRAKLRCMACTEQDYVFLADLSGAASVSVRKQRVLQQYPELDASRLFVVAKEVESWYAAGLNGRACRRLGVNIPATTNEPTRKQFDSLMPRRFPCRDIFIEELLKYYSLDVAKQRNASLRYYVETEKDRLERDATVAFMF